MIKTFKKKIVGALAAIAILFSFTFSPIVVSAEEPTSEQTSEQTSEIVAETSDSVADEEIIGKIYILNEDGKESKLTIIDDKNAVIYLYDYGQEFGSVYLTYVRTIENTGENTIELRLLDGSYFDEVLLTSNGSFEVYDDGVYVPNDTQENSAVLESETNTFENFLAWAEKEADRYGYGDEYRLAFEDIKNAATTKQVTISTVVNALLWLLGVAYIVYKKITDKKNLAKVGDLIQQASAQAKKLNELVDATNKNSKTEEEIRKETEDLKAEMQKTTKALTDFINGFMHFADGVQLKNSRKEEVRRDCTNALKKIDGEVVSNENNEDNKK